MTNIGDLQVLSYQLTLTARLDYEELTKSWSIQTRNVGNHPTSYMASDGLWTKWFDARGVFTTAQAALEVWDGKYGPRR